MDWFGWEFLGVKCQNKYLVIHKSFIKAITLMARNKISGKQCLEWIVNQSLKLCNMYFIQSGGG